MLNKIHRQYKILNIIQLSVLLLAIEFASL